MSISDVLRRLESAWGQPRSAQHGDALTFFKLGCAITWGAAVIPDSIDLPEHLSEFWASAAGARLFVDEEYGQWGLVLFQPEEARTATDRLHLERLIRGATHLAGPGSVLVVPPLDSRDDWVVAAANLLAFVETLESEQGQKFWE